MELVDPLAAARSRVVWPVRVDPSGASGPTRGQAHGRAWRRTSRGLYVPSEIDGADVEQRIAEAAAVLPHIGGVTGWAGLRWAGGVWFNGRRSDLLKEVDLATCYQDIRSQHGYRVWQERLGPSELMTVDGLRMTTPVRCLFFAMRYAASLREAVECADMAAYSDICSIDEATAYALAHPGWTGVPQARDALRLAEENSWSPTETSLRMIWVLDAGLEAPLCNRPLFDRHGRHIGTPDLLDPASGTVAEYDGALHLLGSQRSEDSRRSERFRNHGLEPLHIVGADLSNRRVVAQRIHEARRRAKWERESRRSWTIEAPPWWRETHTVDLRRALARDDQERLLSYRRRVS